MHDASIVNIIFSYVTDVAAGKFCLVKMPIFTFPLQQLLRESKGLESRRQDVQGERSSTALKEWTRPSPGTQHRKTILNLLMTYYGNSSLHPDLANPRFYGINIRFSSSILSKYVFCNFVFPKIPVPFLRSPSKYSLQFSFVSKNLFL